jgi:two-component system, chemotaxis family, chemotaxis protein CheY
LSDAPSGLSHIKSSFGYRRILIADPDSDTRLLYREAFQREGFDVIEASDGRDALTKALMEPPALVITEIDLPILDGIALCEVLRRDAMTRSVPIFVVTMETRAPVLERTRRAGANMILAKPAPLAAIVNDIRRLMTRSSGFRTQSSQARVNSAANFEKSAAFTAHSRGFPSNSAKSYSRFDTTAPPAEPPHLLCPSCDRPMKYDHSHIGGVSARHPEQWDYFICPASCGTFQYRQRTRKLRQLP